MPQPEIPVFNLVDPSLKIQQLSVESPNRNTWAFSGCLPWHDLASNNVVDFLDPLSPSKIQRCLIYDYRYPEFPDGHRTGFAPYLSALSLCPDASSEWMVILCSYPGTGFAIHWRRGHKQVDIYV